MRRGWKAGGGRCVRGSVQAGFSMLLAVALVSAASASQGVISQDFESWPVTTTWSNYTSADGWVLSAGQVRTFRGWGGAAAYSLPNAGWLHDIDASTNSWLRTPWLADGADRLFFWYRNFSGTASNYFAIQSSTNGAVWTTLATYAASTEDWFYAETALHVTNAVYLRFLKTGDEGDNAYLGLDDVEIALPPDLALSGLQTVPASPTVNDPVQVRVSAQIGPAASNVTMAARYRFGGQGAFASSAMASVGGGVWQTVAPIQAGYVGTVQYYVQCDYSGQGPSPVFAPEGGSNAPAQYTVVNPFTTRMRQFGPSSRHTGLIVSEIMYHPKARLDGLNLEYVELFNTEPVSSDISGFRLAGDVDYRFPSNTVFAARSYLVVAADPAAMQSVYGIGNVLGPFTNNLPNGGGTVRLRNRSDASLLEVNYRDDGPWPAAADGAGHSLVLACPDYGEGSEKAWAPSAYIGGSPGTLDPAPPAWAQQVVINELLAHTDPPLVDYIELFNTGTTSVDLSGCYLSDDPDTNKYRIPNGTVIGPRGFALFYQTNGFGFLMDPGGEAVYLVASNQNYVIDAIKYPAQMNAVSSGRYPDGAPGFQMLSSRTAGTSNSVPYQSDIVINEIMYSPISRSDDEYVELYNRGTGSVDMSYWRFTDGIDFMMPPGTVIPSNGYVVVAKNMTNLLAKYGNLNTTNTVGNYGGKLSGRGERLVFSKPDDPALPYEDLVTVDEVTYSDGWGQWTDRGGSSLELTDPRSDNRLAMNWAGSDETTNIYWTLIDYTDSLNNGLFALSPLEIWGLGDAEFVVDDLLFTTGATTNLYENFEAGINGWSFDGTCLSRSSVDAGVGYGGSAGLYVRSSDRGESSGGLHDPRFANHISKDMTVAPSAGQIARIRAKVRWVRGFPFLKIGTRGYWIATPGDVTVPGNLGTPGRRNSSYAANTGPAIIDVSQSPVLPAANEAVVVSCRVYDPDGLSVVSLKYRVDPLFTTNTVPMNDAGTDGDAIAGDGIYSATISGSGKSAGTIVAFIIDAADGAGAPASSRYPARVVPRRSPYECNICWGLPPPGAPGFPTYRAIITQANAAALDDAHGVKAPYSREPSPCTIVYEDFRAIYAGDMKNHSGSTRKGFWLKARKDDPLIGTDEILVHSPAYHDGPVSFLRYQYALWLSSLLGEAAGVSRPAAFARNTAALAGYLDYLPASREICSAWFGDEDPEVFKNADYLSDAFGMYTNNYDGGMKKTVYAGVSNKRQGLDPEDDYTPVYKIAKAASTTDDYQYVRRMQAVVDIRNWALYFSIAGLFGDIDHYGYVWVHNYYAYLPRHDRARLLFHDMDGMFTQGSGVRWPYGGNPDAPMPVTSRMFGSGVPPFVRAYWSVLKEAADGPMRPEISDKWFDDWSAAIVGAGFDPGDTANYKSSVAAGRTAIYSGLAGVAAPFAITTSGGADFSTGMNPVTLVGTAPVYVEDIRVNGSSYRVEYTGITSWQMHVWLGSNANALIVSGYDHGGNLVGSDSITVTYTGPVITPVGKLVINEIMYNATNSYASYVELYNTSTNTLSLGGLRIQGIDCEIGYGNMIGPTGYVVVAGNIPGYQCEYGNAEVVVAEYSGSLDNGGETIRLLMPLTTNTWQVVDEVKYDDDPPWSRQADGGGPSLQLIDATRDNNRVGNWAVGASVRYTPGAPNSVTASLPAFDQIWISEVMPSNTASFKDNAGEYEPWAELYNSGSNSVNLFANGYYLTDSYTNLTKWAFPNGWSVTNNGHLLVWCDNDHPGQTTVTNLHAGFMMNSASGCVALVRVSGGSTIVVDYVNYYLIGAGESYGRYPDGTGAALQVFHYPTPGSANNPASDAVDIHINEWMARNSSTIADPDDGDSDDWFELYNAGSASVDLTGFRLADSVAATSGYTIPGGYTIGARSFKLIWADSETGQNGAGRDLHVNFKLNGDGDAIGLYAPDGTLVDGVVFGAQLTDVGEGRWPNAVGEIYQMPIPTPAASNRLLRIEEFRRAATDTSTIMWNTRAGRQYRLYYTDSLTNSVWTRTTNDDFKATGNTFSTNIDLSMPDGARFYKILQLAD